MARLYEIFFSATDTTRKCVETVASTFGMPIESIINLADKGDFTLPDFTADDMAIVATPVYGGRIPVIAAEKLQRIQGNGAKEIAMVVYGNRDYDDALLELTHILTANGFEIVSAAAFIAQHSIFPKVGASRPDASDINKLKEFGKKSKELLDSNLIPNLNIKGKRPYKEYGGVPVHPVGSQDTCKKCGVCVEQCPADAIDASAPWTTDSNKCISCGRCITVCPHASRRYKGIKYAIIGTLFKAMFSKRKAPDILI